MVAASGFAGTDSRLGGLVACSTGGGAASGFAETDSRLGGGSLAQPGGVAESGFDDNFVAFAFIFVAFVTKC